MEDDSTFKELAEREFGTTEKKPEETWAQLYDRLKAEKKQDQSVINGCSHELDYPEATATSIFEIKKILYKSHLKTPSHCDLCHSEEAAYLNMHPGCHSEACRTCISNTADDEEHYPIQLELNTSDIYCFKCPEPHKLEGTEIAIKVDNILKAPESEQDVDLRRKAEHMLYIQELRREEMSLKHYFVEKQWGRTWMLFRTREGSPLPGRITNNKLARGNNTLDPNVRLPMDKYRPSPETHADIISIKLWRYLEKAYGVQGKAYNEDDIIAPEYARLRVYVDDFKKSIDLYP